MFFCAGVVAGAALWAVVTSMKDVKEIPPAETESSWTPIVSEQDPGSLRQAEPVNSEVGKSPSAQTAMQKVVSVSDDAAKSEVERGRELAKVYCSGCHLYPEPKLLDKVNWAMEVLPDMEVFMGLGEGDPYEILDMEPRVREARLIPDEPMIQSIEDWRAIVTFYLHEAPAEALPQSDREPIQLGLPQFETQVPAQVQSPQTSLIRIDAEAQRLYVGEGTTNTLAMFDSGLNRKGYLTFDSPPSDFILHGNAMYVLQIGDLFPSDSLNGKLAVVGKPGSDFPGGGGDVLTDLPRPVDMDIVDLNGDGLVDVLLCGYGNMLGSLLWYENKDDRNFEKRVIENRPGAIKAHVRDYNQDGRPDLFVMFAQSKEGIYLFENAGNGDFLITPLLEWHPLWGNSYFELVDFDGDGDEDILATNGDNGDHTKMVPPFKNYHGVRIYLNDGQFKFTESWFYPINGAYKAMARDFDQDGDLDIASIAYFADYRNAREETFVYFENQGDMTFKPSTFEETLAGRWLTMDAGDLDGDGDIDIALGALNEGPSIVPSMLRERWRESGPPFVVLRNKLK